MNKAQRVLAAEKFRQYYEKQARENNALGRYLAGKITSGQLVAQMNHQRNDVSGYQMVRACKELGIPKINCEVRIYSSEDEVLRDLIETNIRRRGDVGGSTKQISMRIKELERIYGIKQGGSGYYGNQHEELRNNFTTPKTQDDLAKEMNMSVRTLQNYKKLTEMIPELGELVDTGIVSNTTALAIVR